MAENNCEFFSLTNEMRPYFGLEPVGDTWEEVSLSDTVSVLFDGDIIRKVLSVYRHNDGFSYTETDTVIDTRGRKYLLPRTEKGKEKTLTARRVTHILATGCEFSLGLSTNDGMTLTAHNPRNWKHLPTIRNVEVNSVKKLHLFFDEYANSCPPDYFEKVERMKYSPHVTVRYKAGDIFRFAFDRRTYGFGLVMGEVRKIRKSGIFPKDHPVMNLMEVPIIARLYRLRTEDPDMPAVDVVCHPMLPSFYVSDSAIIWGRYDIIGSKELVETDIDFPIHVKSDHGYHASAGPVTLFWGVGHIRLVETVEIQKLLRRASNDNDIFMGVLDRFANNGVLGAIDTERIDEALAGGSGCASPRDDLRDESNREMREAILKLFGLHPTIDFDTFNRLNGGLTRKEIADRFNSMKVKRGVR